MEKTKCKQCGKKFDSDTALKQHLKDKHSGESNIVKPKQLKRFGIYLILVLIFVGIGYGIFVLIQTSSKVGAVGSTHIHADMAISLNGQEITPLPEKYWVKSRYAHVEAGSGAGSVIHMHATDVPLSLFFQSLGMGFDSNCFKLGDGSEYCNSGDKTLKFYVKHVNGDWRENNQFGDYVFEDLDKILISYGNETPEQVIQQQNSVTDFAKENG